MCTAAQPGSPPHRWCRLPSPGPGRPVALRGSPFPSHCARGSPSSAQDAQPWLAASPVAELITTLIHERCSGDAGVLGPAETLSYFPRNWPDSSCLAALRCFQPGGCQSSLHQEGGDGQSQGSANHNRALSSHVSVLQVPKEGMKEMQETHTHTIIRVCTCTHAHIHLHIHNHTCTQCNMRISTCTCMRMRKHMHRHTHNMHTYTHVQYTYTPTIHNHMCMYMHTYTYTPTQSYMYAPAQCTPMHNHICMHMHRYTHNHTCMYMHTHNHACTHVHTCTHAHTNMQYMRMNTCTHA